MLQTRFNCFKISLFPARRLQQLHNWTNEINPDGATSIRKQICDMERLKQNKQTEISRAILCNMAAAAAAFPLCLQTSTATIHIHFMRSAISLSGCGFHIQASCHDFNMLFWGSVLCPLASIRSKTSAFFRLGETLTLCLFAPHGWLYYELPQPAASLINYSRWISAVLPLVRCWLQPRSSLFQILYSFTLKQIGVMLLKRPVLHFCCFLIPPPAIQQSLCEKRCTRCSFQAMSCTVINVDEWGGRPSLFQPSLNRKFPLSLTMYSLYQSDRVEASHTPLPSLCPYTLPLYRPAPKNRGKPEEAAKITVHKTGKIYMTLSLESHPSTPPGYNYPHATRKKTKKKTSSVKGK